MARARNIKPGFFKNEDLAECTSWARLCFAVLWTLADREGRLEDRPKRIKGDLFAYDSIEVDPLLCELASFGFILRYQVEAQRYIQITAFLKHQNPHHKEQPSIIPSPEKSPGLGGHGTDGKPEASGPCNEAKAPGKPQASPGLDGDECAKHGGETVLIPDSLLLIPDSLEKPSASSSAAPTRRASTIPPCPYGAIKDLYNEALPELPFAKTMVDTRKRAMSRRWAWIFTEPKTDGTRRATTADEALAWMRDYFERARGNDFLMKRIPRSVGHENWNCDLDFLLSDKGLMQVLEKTEAATA